MGLEDFFQKLLSPFQWLRSTLFNIKQKPMQLKGAVSRVKAQTMMAKSDFQSYRDDAKNAAAQAQQIKGKYAGGVQMPQMPNMPWQQGQAAQGQPGAAQPGMPQQGMPQQGMPQQGMPQQGWGAPAGGAMPQGMGGPQFPGPMGGAPGAAVAGQPKRAKMGWFSKKKKCPSCAKKLHVSWTECPYCGWGRGAPPPHAMPMPMMQAPMPQMQKQRTMALDMNAPMMNMGPVSDGLVGWFIPLEGKQAGELFQVRGRMTIGKSPVCNIVVDEPSISGTHAEFVPTSNGFRLNDLGSTNGTYVNDKRVTTHDLVDNDNVRLGRLNFKYKSMV